MGATSTSANRNQMERNNKHNVWPEWDAELNRFGDWLIVGCIASASLPPVPGVVSLFLVFYVGATRAESTAKDLFKERKQLQEKENSRDISPEEAKRYDILLGDLRRSHRKRDTRVYWVSCFALILTLIYLVYKLSALPFNRWML
jgi:hypothetical protein